MKINRPQGERAPGRAGNSPQVSLAPPPRQCSRRRPAWIPAVLALVAAAALAGCQDYYIPPPPVSITVSAPVSELPVSSIDSSGDVVVGTAQMTASVLNTTNTNVIWSVGQNGNYVVGGDSTLGTITNTGLYTAPASAPTPNLIDIEGASAADPTQISVTTITLLNPPAMITSVTPAYVVAGLSYTLDIVGSNFFPDPVVQVAGAQVGTVDYIGSTEVKVPVQVNSSGILNVSIQNQASQLGGSQGFPIRSQPQAPPASSTVGVIIGQTGTATAGAPILSTEAYVPEPTSVGVVNLDTGAQIASVYVPSGFVPAAVAANPAQNSVVVISSTTPTLQVIGTQQQTIVESYPIPATGTATFNDRSCTVCSVIVDTVRNQAILSTASGWMTVNLANGQVSTPIQAPPAETFGYNPLNQQILAPYTQPSGAGLNLINLSTGAVQQVQTTGATLGFAPEGAAYDPGSGVAIVSDASDSLYSLLNFNNSSPVGSNAVTVPASEFGVTNACAGTWNTANVDPATHLGWLADTGSCLAVVQLPTSPPTGPPGVPMTVTWTQLGLGPDSIAWSNTSSGGTFDVETYTGPDGLAYGLAVRADGRMMVKMDLAAMESSPVLATTTNTTTNVVTNQVNVLPPAGTTTTTSTTPPTLTYIPLH